MNQGEDLFGITYEKNDVIFREGDMGDNMYIIQSGAVEISHTKDGHKHVLAILESGNFFGESHGSGHLQALLLSLPCRMI